MNLWLLLLLIGVLLIAAVLTLFWHPQRSRTKTTSTFADRGYTGAVFRDNDRYWSGGVFYNNPDDPALFVPKRFGLGWTLNSGHAQAKLFLIGILLVVLVCGVLLPVLFPGVAHTGCHPSGCNP